MTRGDERSYIIGGVRLLIRCCSAVHDEIERTFDGYLDDRWIDGEIRVVVWASMPGSEAAPASASESCVVGHDCTFSLRESEEVCVVASHVLTCSECAKTVVRAIRALVIFALWDTHLFIRASCVANRDGAVAFAADSGGGKSTLMTAWLAGAGERLVANDKIAVRRLQTTFLARGFPIAAGLRPTAVRMINRLNAAALLCPGPDGRAYISLGELARVLGVEISPCSQLTCIVFPMYLPECVDPSIRRLDLDEAESRMRSVVLGFRRVAPSHDYVRKIVGQERERPDRVEIVGALTSSLPMYALRYSDECLALAVREVERVQERLVAVIDRER